MIVYATSVSVLSPEQLGGFFVGWPNPPAPETHCRLLQAADRVVVAIDDSTSAVVGFVTALTDGVLSAYIPLLEVLPAYQQRGIGTELVRRMLEQLEGLYMVDLQCDPNLEPFYARFGLVASRGMSLRNYARQSGRAAD